MVLRRDGESFCDYCLKYSDRIEGDDRARIVVDIELAEHDIRIPAMIDTGGVWLVLPRRYWEAWAADQEPLDSDTLRVRGDSIEGDLRKIEIALRQDDGAGVQMPVTAFCAKEPADLPRPLPVILGYSGCLEYLRFAVDPAPDRMAFYFSRSDSLE